MNSQVLFPAIVIVAYDRPKSLARILSSIARADYTGYTGIPLVISIDKSGDKTVSEVADNFVWEHGAKQIITRESRLGLRNHIIACGDLTEEFGAVILLEDDLYVSPIFYDYAVRAMLFFGGDEAIGGISLYGYDLNEYAVMRFCALDDGHDNYFIQTASSWGQLWTKQQWDGFRRWYAENSHLGVSQDDPLPNNVINWGENSWKKYFIKYLVLEKKYFVFPRTSLTTNFGDIGVHTKYEFCNLRVPLALQRKPYRFCPLAESTCIYDSYFELEARCAKFFNPALAQFDFECDLYGIKKLEKIKTQHLLSVRDCVRPIRSYAMKQIPFELNIAFEMPGDFFHLGRVGDFGGIQGQKKLTQLRMLHKDLGWRPYRNLFVRGLRERLGW